PDWRWQQSGPHCITPACAALQPRNPRMESLKIRFAGACRSTLLCILLLTLCGCGSPRFAGESVSDPVLRRDALRHVEMLHQCRQLRQVSPEILGFQLDSPDSLAFARER